MAAVFADANFKCIFLNENDGILIRIPLSAIDNNPPLLK